MEQALRNADLEGLGTYFFDTLGRLSLADYADDEDAREVVSKAVRTVGRFLSADMASTPSPPPGMASPGDAERAEVGIAEGDLWGGLSRLRRTIESNLRAAADNADVPAGGGAGQLLRRLQRAEVIDSATFKVVARSIEICNRGVHGQEVSGEEADEALALADDGVARLHRGLSPQ